MTNRKQSNPKKMLLPRVGKYWKMIVIGLIALMIIMILFGFVMGPDKMWKPINRSIEK